MGVGSFKLPIMTTGSSSGGNLTPTPYVRPSDWLPIDSLVSVGQQKFVGLIAVMEEGNWVTIQCQGAFTVDWGDGTVTNYASATIANYQHSYASFPGTECSRGYRQAIVTVTPQVGQNLTQLYLHNRHSSVSQNYGNRWLDIKMSAPNMTGMLISSNNILSCRMLEQFDYVGTNSLSNLNNMFANCIRLQKVKNLYMQNVTAMANIFLSCQALEEVDFMSTPNVQDFSGAFNGCVNIKRFPNLDTSKGTNFTSTFNTCISVVEFPTLNCFMSTNFSSMFNACYGMIKSPTITTDPNKTKNFSSMFSNCYALEEFIDFDTQRSNNYSNMFQNCYSLKTFPTTFKTNTVSSFVANGMFSNCQSLDTAPNMDLTTCTTTASMFSTCYNLQLVPNYTFGGTSIASMFGSCTRLTQIPIITFLSGAGTVNMNGALTGCVSLEEAPNWDMSKAFDVTNMFNGNNKLLRCPAWNLANVNTVTGFGGGGMFLSNFSLYKVDLTGIRYAINFQACNLSRTELVKIFNNLGIAVGAQVINITNNYGAATLTAGERAIATGKGWTITG